LDRRHRLKEKQHGDDIRKQQALVEKQTAEEFDGKRHRTVDELTK
jgi:hypothetical protein